MSKQRRPRKSSGQSATQRRHTAAVQGATGNPDGCAVCGDTPAAFHDLAGSTGGQLRLCDECVTIRHHMFRELWITAP